MTPWTWKQYKEWIESTIDAKKNYFYRGQRDPSWKLQTSFHREATAFNYSLLDYLNIIVPEINYYVSAQQNEMINLDNKVELTSFLALLQHHGFPTPLLDWSLSPYIAAYFAFRDLDEVSPQSDHVQIYIFDSSEWISTYEQIYDLRETTKDYVSVIRPAAMNNQRLIAQRGAYTISNVNDLESHLLNMGSIKQKTFLYVVDIPITEKPKVMKDLNLMGINEMTLFPGMDGICKTLKNNFFSREIMGLGPSGRALFNELAKSTPNNQLQPNPDASPN